MNIGGAADARFEHAAVPDGNAVAGAEIVQPDRFSESANPTRLDVDDAARAGGDRVARRVHGLDRLVKADSGSQRCRAYRSQAAISTAAFAMLWPRIAFSAGKISLGCAKPTPRTRGAMKSLMMCHAVSLVSAL